MDDPSQSGDLLQRMRDLIAITALPALWIGQTPSAILKSLTSTVGMSLGVDIAHTRATLGDPPTIDEAWHVAPTTSPEVETTVRAAMSELIAGRRGLGPSTGRLDAAGVELSWLIIPFGYKNTIGHFAVFSEREDFPDAAERVICQVSANQVAISLREADLVRRLEGTVSVLRTVTGNAAVCFFVVDEEGRCTYMNPTAERVFGYSTGEIYGRNVHDTLHHTRPDGSPYPASECPMSSVLTERRPVGAHEAIMFCKDNTPVSVLCSAVPIADETGIGAAIFEMQDISEWKRAEIELLKKARYETLMNRIGLAIRTLHDPDEIEAKATELLGQALTADRCFFVHIDADSDYMRFHSEWRSDDLPSIAGNYRPSQFGVEVPSLFTDGQTLVVRDITAEGWPEATIAMLQSLRLRSVVDVPLFRNSKLEALLCVGRESAHDWTEDEVRLVEAVASQARTAIDAAAVIQREHRIATTLQEALLPPLPRGLPDLELAYDYRAALNESNVGGDFYAVYPIDKARFAIVIGDVSGKGLAAASQVSTVQNMIRYALCASPSIAHAVTQMNAIVCAQNLLSGFATAFIGVYNTAGHTLSYVSCGHEPPLIIGAEGLRKLETTGPPLGAIENAVYTEKAEILADGDLLAMYTDGISEAGTDRRSLLGTEGLADLITRYYDREAPVSTIAERIITAVLAFANNQLRDDVCLILGLRRRTSTIEAWAME